MPEPFDFPVLVSTGTTRVNRTGTWRAFRPVYVQYASPCREACPAGEDIARWIDLLRGRNYKLAWEILTEDNPFPATMGRICIHPCESNCNRRQHDEAVGINALEQFLGDMAIAEGWAFEPPAIERPERVAVVGAGPAGLSCTYHLRRLGYRVTLFEARGEPGGNLRHALPDYQLPVDVVRAEVERILAMGVDLRAGVRVGEDIAWDEVRRTHDAVFIAIGAPVGSGLSTLPPIPEDLPEGVHDALRFLEAVKAGDRRPPGARVVVVGGGLTGIEAARTLRRLGSQVTLLTAEAEEDLPLPERIEEARAEGVEVVCGAPVERVDGDGSGPVAAVLAGGERFPADAVMLATGRMPDLALLPDEAEVDERYHLVADPFTGRTGMVSVFAGGDVTGSRYAAEAVGAGKRAAAAIDAYLRGLDPAEALAPARLGYSPNISMRLYARPGSYPAHLRVDLRRVVDYAAIEAIYFDPLPRTSRRSRPAADRTGCFDEVRIGLTEAEALAESRRCFNCGTCIGCDNCLIFCPDMAITRLPDGQGFEVNLDYCKGCGACVSECPREALVLEEEIR